MQVLKRSRNLGLWILLWASFSVTSFAQATSGGISGDQDNVDQTTGVISGDEQVPDYSNGQFNQYDCRQYSYSPRVCERTPGCQYSRIFGECVQSTDGPIQPIPPPGQRCSQFNYQYSDCVAAGCFFDSRSQLCQSRQQPQPQPRRCEAFNFDEMSCRRASCQYDRASGLCLGSSSPQPHPRRWICYSESRYATNSSSRQYEGQGRTQSEASQQAAFACSRYESDCIVTSCRQF